MSQLLINGKWVNGETADTLFDRYTGKPYGHMQVASADQIQEAVAAANRTFAAAALSPDERYRILNKTATLLEQRRADFVDIMIAETGFPRADCEGELNRCLLTLSMSADEARRIAGEVIPLDATPNLVNRMGYTILVPRGVVCAITPYNSPLNVVAHKVAPALAGGNVVVLKPSEYTPLTAVMLCEALIDAGLPPEHITLLHGPGASVGQALLDDPRIAFYAFTGSTRVGKMIQAAAGLRGTQLELGSIASTIVMADADLAVAAKKITAASFRKAGQVCTSVQRVLVDRTVEAEFADRVTAAVRDLSYGDPREAGTVVGPMISEDAAIRAEKWVNEALQAGATCRVGGERNGNVYAPTVLTNVPEQARVICEEIFAPVLSIIPFETEDQAYALANNTPFGLAAGVFTGNISVAMRAGYKLQFGGIHINETSSSRVDVMPFGGVKDSGSGREGPRYAIREMMEERLITVAY